MPAENGSVTPSVAAAATAASTALPPWRSTSRPTAVAVASTVVTAPPYPVAVDPRAAGVVTTGRADGAAAAGAATSVTGRVRAASTGKIRIDPPKWAERTVYACLSEELAPVRGT